MAQKVYLNPKIDYGFKIIFGQQSHKEPLIGLLNAILYGGQKTIQDLTIVNPYLPGNVESIKDTYVDVQAELNDGRSILIEMQSILNPDFLSESYTTPPKSIAVNCGSKRGIGSSSRSSHLSSATLSLTKRSPPYSATMSCWKEPATTLIRPTQISKLLW